MSDHEPIVAPALSTMYFQRWRDPSDLRPFFALGREIGFAHFEVGLGLSPEALATVDPARVRIAAVHHPCPTDDRSAPGDRLTASDATARARAAEALRRTIDTAARVGAPAVVAHLGHVEDDETGTARRLRFELENRYRAGQGDTARCDHLRRDLGEWLAAREDAHLERAVDEIAALLDHARGAGVRLGFETGKHAHELPSARGVGRLLAPFDRDVGAWLDTGHVGALANLGLTTFDAWFAAVGDRWIGIHCHDVVGLRDHLVPGTGGLDFAAIASRLPAEAVVTCEVDWYFTPDEVRNGRIALEHAFKARARPLP